jgi:hypothetical protein
MKLTQTKLDQLVKEELQKEGFFDKMHGMGRKMQQATGLGRKPWTHKGTYNRASVVVDELMSDLYKQFPEMTNVYMSITIESYVVEDINVANVQSEFFNAIVSIDPETGEALFNTLNIYTRGRGMQGVNPRRRPKKEYRHLDFDAGETILFSLFRKALFRYAHNESLNLESAFNQLIKEELNKILL